MAKKTIELGTAPDGMDGDDARTAFQKTNDNFTELYQGVGGAQPASPKLSAIASSVWAANQLLIATGADTIGGLLSGTTGRALIAAGTAAEGRSAIAAQASHANLTGLASVSPGADRLPMFTDNAGSMTFLQVGAAGKQLVSAATWDNVRTLIEYTRPYTTSTKETGSFDDHVSPGWAPELYRDAPLTNSPGNTLVATQRPSYWYVHNTLYGPAGTIVQVVYPYSIGAADKGSICWRNRYGGVWGTWQRALTQQDLVSGTYDGTPGRVVTTGAASGNGWMGLGASSTPAVANLNTIYATSFYTFNDTAVGRPPQFGYGNVLTVIRAGNEATQIAFSVVSPMTVTRYLVGGVWSPWRIEYNALNCIGSVSFSGGENSGAIIERGTGPQGNWTRFADGTLEMWGPFTTPNLAAADPVPAQVAISLPFNFVDTSFVVTAHAAPASSWTGFDGCLFCTPGSTSYFTVNIRNRVQAQTSLVHWRAIGRWRNA
ncbi:hypothetical protein [Pseudomonas mosselii]|uniref:pyocin knob domain-containing protein n=1 Tax=Pseudomonas mosselii TaxID=78327 RepID=UPI003F2AA532